MQFEKYVPKYQALCKEYYGEEISYKNALDGVIRLFNFAKAISKPIPKKEHEEFTKEEKKLKIEEKQNEKKEEKERK